MQFPIGLQYVRVICHWMATEYHFLIKPLVGPINLDLILGEIRWTKIAFHIPVNPQKPIKWWLRGFSWWGGHKRRVGGWEAGSVYRNLIHDVLSSVCVFTGFRDLQSIRTAGVKRGREGGISLGISYGLTHLFLLLQLKTWWQRIRKDFVWSPIFKTWETVNAGDSWKNIPKEIKMPAAPHLTVGSVFWLFRVC